MGLREGPAARPPDRPTDAPRAAATPPCRDEEKVLQPPMVVPPGPGPSGAQRSAAGRRTPRARQPARAGGRVQAAVRRGGRPCLGDNVGLAVGRALPGASQGRRASCGRRRAFGRGAPRPPLAPSPAAHAHAGRPGRTRTCGRRRLPAFRLQSCTGTVGLGAEGRCGPKGVRPGAVGPTARAFVWAPRARRLPWADGDRKGCEPRSAARGIRNRRVRSAAEEAVTPDGSVWPPLGLEGKATSLGSRGEKSVYKTKPWVCLRREFTTGRFRI